MDFTTAELKKFQTLYQKHFGIELDNKSARRKFALLVRQMELVYQPITKTQFAAFEDVNGDEDEQPKENLQQ